MIRARFVSKDSPSSQARKHIAKPLRASQSLSETFPCTGYKSLSPRGEALRGDHLARSGIWVTQVAGAMTNVNLLSAETTHTTYAYIYIYIYMIVSLSLSIYIYIYVFMYLFICTHMCMACGR